MTIPASQYASVQPNALAGGGAGLDLIGLMLTTNQRVPIGSVPSFPTAAGVSAYFGPSSAEYAASQVYFAGFINANKQPGALLLAQYPETAVAGYLRGGSLASMTLAQLQALSGTLTIDFAGVSNTSTNISLAAATSFSNAATIIEAAFTSPSFGTTFDSIASAFVFTSTASGATETITYATGTLSAGLLLTQATGAVLSQGAAAATPSAFMTGIINQTTNWATFKTLFDPDNGTGNTQKQAFAAWNTLQNNRYLYVAWDTDVTVTAGTSTTCLGAILKGNDNSGTALITEPSETGIASFVMGAIASIDFTETNGRSTLAYKSQSGIIPSVTDPTSAANATGNGYNYYGAVATANQQFQFFYPGSVTGQFLFIDSYVNQIWLNNQFQLALIELLTQMKSIPYDPVGYGLIESALADPIAQGLNFGMYAPNVTLSATQIAEVNYAAGANIAPTLQNIGSYLQVLPASAQVRANRGTPPCTFWYNDGGSIQQINLASVAIL